MPVLGRLLMAFAILIQICLPHLHDHLSDHPLPLRLTLWWTRCLHLWSFFIGCVFCLASTTAFSLLCCTLSIPEHWVVSPGLPTVFVSQTPAQDTGVIDPNDKLGFSPLMLKSLYWQSCVKYSGMGARRCRIFIYKTVAQSWKWSAAGHSPPWISLGLLKAGREYSHPCEVRCPEISQRESKYGHSACSWTKRIYPSLYPGTQETSNR